MKYALINSGIVSNIILLENGANYPITGNMVDITNISPQPNIGDSYSNGIFTSPVIPTPTTEEYAILAKNAAQAYISKFYTNIELLHILQILLQGSPTKKTMCADVQNWINSIVEEALSHATSPDFEQFTPPPHTYLEILEAN